MSAVAPADATGLLYERHSQRIFGYCLSLLGSREDAEDAVQTTFVNAHRGLGRGVVPQFELAWLFTIARNVCYNARATSSRRGRHEGVADLDALQDVLAAPERGSATSIEELTRALSSVPERQRRALLLREVRGLSYEEIAAELAVTVPAVETLIFRARRSVAEQLVRPGRRRRGLLPPVSTLLRWLFQGGAAPIKIAAATATLVGTATLAVVAPATHHGGGGSKAALLRPGKAAVQTARAVTPPPREELRRGARTARPHGGVQPTRAVGAESQLPHETTPSQPPREQQPLTSPAQQGAAAPAEPPTTVSVPAVSTPTVTPPTATLPTVTPPPVDVPQVELPLDAPSVPAGAQLP
jgi:RNA polymerase sigma-70 factor (ECF subfamily)